MQQDVGGTVRVLHADDDPGFRELVAELLDEHAGIELVSASTLSDAIDGALEREAVQEVEYAVDTDAGTTWYEAHVAPLPADGGSAVVVVARDITTQRQYEQRLESQNERLDEFASMVSHDLRNPLNVVQGRLELIDSQVDDREAVCEHVDAARSATERMTDLIEDTLAVARTEERSLTVGPVSLREASERAWSAVEAAEADFSVAVDGESRIRADEGELIRLFENLFRNAVEHGSTGSQAEPDDAVEHGSTSSRTPSGDSVEHGSTDDALTVSVECVDDGFAVEDDGPGVPAEHRDRIFESGYSTATDGTGYGLDIVERVADAHGWSVELADGGEGARFEISGVEFAGACGGDGA